MISEIATIRSADGVGQTGSQYCGARYVAFASRHGVVGSHACVETSRARTERPGCHPWPQGGGSVGGVAQRHSTSEATWCWMQSQEPQNQAGCSACAERPFTL